jgi:hypothetical protein
MRVEAESTSSHGAAIVAFEASGLARVFLPKRLRSNGFKERFVCGPSSAALVLHPELRCRNPQLRCVFVSFHTTKGRQPGARAPPQFAAPSASSQP